MALLAHFTLEADAFTLGRDITLVIDDDSHETTTDNLLVDSAERNPTSSTEDHSLEAVNSTHLVVKRNPLPATVDQQPVQIHVDVSDYSWEDLIENVAKLDDTKAPVDSQPPAAEAIQQQQQQIVIDYDDSLEDLLENVAAHHIHGTPQTVSDADLVPVQQVNVPSDGSPPTWNDSTSSVLVIRDDYDDDFSLEDYTEFVNPDAVQLTATDFHHLTQTLFTHPTSDDWFLVKHFMDDHYVLELGDELVKEYFWKPLKAFDTMNIQHQQPQTAVQK